MDLHFTMPRTDPAPIAQRMARLARACLTITLGIVLCAALGWATGWQALTSFIPGAKSIAPSTLLLFTTFTFIIYLDLRPSLSCAARIVIMSIAALVCLVTVTELVLLTWWPAFSIEQHAMRLLYVPNLQNIRISPIALLLSFITAGALLLRQQHQLTGKGSRLVGWVSVLALTITFTFLLGYAYSTPVLFGSSYLPIALPALSGYLLLHVAMLCSLGPTAYPLAWFLDGSTRARLLSVFVPFIFIIMPLDDWIEDHVNELFDLNGAVTSAATSLAFTGVVVLVIVLVARQVGRRIDATLEALQESETRLRYESERLLVTLRSIGDGVIVSDRDGHTILLNSVAEQLTGWTHAEAFGHPIATIFHIVNEDTRAVVENPVNQVVETGAVVGLANHTVLIARDGREFAIADSGAPIHDADGAIIGVILVFRDVTEERVAEQLLRDSEERFHQLFTAMTEGFALHEIICDPSGAPVDYRYLDLNPAFGALTGMNIDQAIGRTVRELMPDIEDKWIDLYGKVALTGESIHITETAAPLGRTFDIFAYSPCPGQFATIFMDVTERHRDEERLLVTLRSIGDGVIVTDAEGRVVLLNPVAEALTGWLQPEAEGQPIHTVFHIVNEDTRVMVENPVAKVVETGTIVGLANHTVLIARDGREYAIADSGAPIRGADGAIIGVVLVFRDVTDERKAEHLLRDSEAMLRASQRIAKVGHYVWDIVADRWTSSEALDTIFGIDTAYARTVAGWLTLIHPDDRAMITDYLAHDVIRQRQPFDKEYRIMQPADTSIRWVHGLGSLTYTDNGTPLTMFGTIQDITEHKQAEARIRLHVENLERLARIAQHQTDSTQELLDYALEEALQLTNSQFGYIYFYSEEREEFVLNTWSSEVMATCAVTNPQTVYQLENTGLWGEVVRQRQPILVNDFAAANPLKRGLPAGHAPLRNFLSVPVIANGKIVAVAGVANTPSGYDETDIHQLTLMMDSVWRIAERKRIESRHHTILHTALDGFMIVDAATLRYVEVNDAICRMLGYSADELLRMTVMDIEASESPEIVRQHADAMMATGSGRFESRHRHRDGRAIAVNQSIRYFPETHQFVVFSRDITARINAEAEIIRSRDFAVTLFEHFPDMIWRTDAHGQLNYFNQTWSTFIGHPVDADLGDGWLGNVHPDDREMVEREFRQAFTSRAPFEMRCRVRRHDGEYRWINDYGRPYADLDGDFAGYLGVCRDITEHLLSEAQLRQAVKMESVGRLAGGVAHDFNNILTGIIGLTQLAQAGIPAHDQARGDLDEVLTLAERAANLTRQLLAFSRRQTIEPGYLNMNDLVAHMLKMLTRLIGEDITLRFHPAANLGTVYADPGQMEQILLNLAVNARDAMPTGGSLIIETANVEIDQAFADLHPSMSPGLYVQLVITDTGEGMDAEVQQHIFEPFFTTKDVGQGTGLGLATVYGIVKQHNGNIWVYSEPGKGTSFKIYLPHFELLEPDLTQAPTAQRGIAGSETILLVEDEDAVRATILRILASHGYQVLEAATPRAALELFSDHAASIALLLSDVIMPGQNGLDLYTQLLEQRPELKALFVSGYSDTVLVNTQALPPGSLFIQKPFTRYLLLEKVREVLDAPVTGGIHDNTTR